MKLVFKKPGNFRKFSTITIFIILLYLVTFTADVGLLTSIGYYDWLVFHGRISDYTEIQLFNLFQSDSFQLQITICSCQLQKNGADCRIYTVAIAFEDFHSRGILQRFCTTLKSRFKHGKMWCISQVASQKRWKHFPWSK